MWKRYSEKYEASTDGHIRNTKTKRVLHEFPGKDRYLRTQYILPEVNHKDGDKSNNSVDNLEWCTRSDNLKHAYTHGLRTAKGTNNARCKLSADNVAYIKNNYIRGDRQYGAKALASKFNVAPQTVCAVISGQNWKGEK